MKYNTVKITVNKQFCVGPKWDIELSKSHVDREDVQTHPNDLGFYHYPETMSDEDAFKILLNSMILRHEVEIEDLTKSLNELKKLTM